MNTKSKWTSRVTEDGVVVILDIGVNEKSVTNDAENVLAVVREELGAEVFDAAPAVIYRDSSGDFDGLLFDPEIHFAGFYPLTTKDEMEAVRRALGLKRGTISRPAKISSSRC